MRKTVSSTDEGVAPKKKAAGKRLTKEQKDIIAQRLREGAGLTLLSREFGVSRGTIYNVRMASSEPSSP